MVLTKSPQYIVKENKFGCSKKNVINWRLDVVGLALAHHGVAQCLALDLVHSHAFRGGSPAPLPGRDVSQQTSTYKVNYIF